MSHDHLDWPRLSYREQFYEGDEEADRGNDGKSGLALNGTPYYGKPRTARSAGSWLQNLQWWPNGQPDYRIDKMRRDLNYVQMISNKRDDYRLLSSEQQVVHVRLHTRKQTEQSCAPQTEADILTNLPLWSRRPNHRACSTKMPPSQSYKKRCVACQHSPDDQTIQLQAGAERTTSFISQAALIV